MFRFSLLTLLGVVLVAAVGSAALANPTDIWRRVTTSIIVVILLLAALFAFSSRPMSRCAIGFALTGWLYLILSFSSTLGVREHLLTELVSMSLWQWVHPSDSPASFDRLNATMYLGQREPNPFGGGPTPMREWYNFAAICRSLWTLLLATIGGLFASWLGRRRDADRPP